MSNTVDGKQLFYKCRLVLSRRALDRYIEEIQIYTIRQRDIWEDNCI